MVGKQVDQNKTYQYVFHLELLHEKGCNKWRRITCGITIKERSTGVHIINLHPITLWRISVGLGAERNTVLTNLECEAKVWGEENFLSCVCVCGWVMSLRVPDNYVQHHVIFFYFFAFQSHTHFLLSFVLFPLNRLILLFLQLFLHLSAKALTHCAALCEWSLLIANLPQINFRMREENGRMERKDLKG